MCSGTANPLKLKPRRRIQQSLPPAEECCGKPPFFYEETITTGYLICSPPTLASKLKHEIVEHLAAAHPPFFDYHRDSRWMLSMLLYSLESNQELADKALQKAEHERRYISDTLRRFVRDKSDVSMRLMNGRRNSRRYPMTSIMGWDSKNADARNKEEKPQPLPSPLFPSTQLRPRSRLRSEHNIGIDSSMTERRRRRPRSPTPEGMRSGIYPLGGRGLNSSPSPSRSPSPPPVIKGPTIEREVITHYRDIDHGKIQPLLYLSKLKLRKQSRNR